MSGPEDPTVALDARLVYGANTGDSTYWSGLVYGLAALDLRLRILLISGGPKPAEVIETANCKWISLPARSSRWWSMVRFPLAARKLGAGAIHTQYSLSPLAGSRGITTIHDVSFLIGPEWFKPKDRMILSRTVPAAVRRAARVFAVSETCKREIEAAIPAAIGKTVVTPNACPPWISRIDRAEATRAVRESLGVQAPHLLTVGTRWPRKNMRLAVEAADGLGPQLPHSLVITGSFGWGESSLGSRGKAVGYVGTHELSCLYSAADLYLAPSRHEGFGIPVLEAFRCGCPVLCSSGGALPEVAADAAEVETSWDAAAWTASIEKLLGDPSKLDALRMKGLQREKFYTWEKTALAAVAAYREVAQ